MVVCWFWQHFFCHYIVEMSLFLMAQCKSKDTHLLCVCDSKTCSVLQGYLHVGKEPKNNVWDIATSSLSAFDRCFKRLNSVLNSAIPARNNHSWCFWTRGCRRGRYMTLTSPAASELYKCHSVCLWNLAFCVSTSHHVRLWSTMKGKQSLILASWCSASSLKFSRRLSIIEQ